jgi:uncharacterized Zn finger protein
MSWGYEWRPYVSVAQRRAKAQRYAEKLAKGGRKLKPVEIAGRKIATTFWGAAWCDNLESYSDFANRLPRGRTYARNGSVIDLQIDGGQITAIVSGSEIYKVRIDIAPLPRPQWKAITRDCSQSIDSLMDLLQGRFSQGVMERLARQKDGLFPRPNDIKLKCSCPDWAGLCKHLAAVLYGVGARLDSEPELLFTLRKVDHLELVGRAVDAANLDQALGAGTNGSLGDEDLAELFGIDLDAGSTTKTPQRTPRRKAAKPSAGNGKPTRKKTAKETVPVATPAAKKRSASPRKKPAATTAAKSSAAVSRRKSAKPKPAAATKRRAAKSKP